MQLRTEQRPPRAGAATGGPVNVNDLLALIDEYAQAVEARTAHELQWSEANAAADQAETAIKAELDALAYPICDLCRSIFPQGGVDFLWREAREGESCGAADHSVSVAWIRYTSMDVE